MNYLSTLESLLIEKEMKRLLALFIVLGLLGCNSDDDVSDDTLVGSWLLVDWFDVVPRDINDDGLASTDLYSQWDGCNKNSLLVLNADGSSELFYLGPNNNPNCPPDTQTNDGGPYLPWDANDGNLRFIGSDFFDTYPIQEHGGNNLVLQGSGFLTCCNQNIGFFTGGFLRFIKQ